MEFRVSSLTTPEGRVESEKYDWQGKLHGLVGFDTFGKQAILIPGHEYGKERVRAAVEELLR